MAVELRPAVFLDKDGTLVENVPYNIDPHKIRLRPGVAAGLSRLRQAGYLLVMVTNQSGIARGYFREDQFVESAGRLNEIIFKESSVRLDAWYYCPHHPTEGVGRYRVDCDCRKPRPGMLVRAAAAYGLDLAASFVIGDKASDTAAGHNAGCLTVLVQTGYGATEWQAWHDPRQPDCVAANLLEAAHWVLGGRGAG